VGGDRTDQAIARCGRPTQTWKRFLRNHLAETAAIDFLTVPTASFRTQYVFVVPSLGVSGA
jgi:hypothetical protein